MTGSTPYRVTLVFDQDSLPNALRNEHRTKAGVWAVIRVLEGRLRLTSPSGTLVLTPDRPGLIDPQVPHWVEPLGSMKMQVEFFDAPPDLGEVEAD